VNRAVKGDDSGIVEGTGGDHIGGKLVALDDCPFDSAFAANCLWPMIAWFEGGYTSCGVGPFCEPVLLSLLAGGVAVLEVSPGSTSMAPVRKIHC
jgi:hypothetical protein